MSGFDEYAGYIGLRSFTRKLAVLFAAAVAVGVGVRLATRLRRWASLERPEPRNPYKRKR
jgi:hypothetical protein